MRHFRPVLFITWLLLANGVINIHGATNDYFAIQVVDEQTGRGVPLVELRTVNHISFWTDSGGIVAFNEPGLMDIDVFFFVQSPGFEFPKDGFDYRGVKLKPTHGGSATVKLKRLNIAERLYRITGQGIYRDSILVGRATPLREPLLDAQVFGQDTVIATPYRGKIYWFWGDTDQASYPLGNFSASGATSELPARGGLDPSAGIDLTYFTDTNGFSKPMCHLTGGGLHWIESLFTVPDERGVERLIARVANYRSQRGAESWDLIMFDDAKADFEPLQHWDSKETHDSAHPFHAREDGVDYFYLYPNWRVKADLKSLYDTKNYEALTCIAGDGKIRDSQIRIDRDATGRANYSWKSGADRLNPGRIRELISNGKLKADESWIDLVDFKTGARINAGRGSVFWNDYRRRWVMLMSAKPGEIWFAEADTPSGPWAYAQQVVTHGDYNFYNPTQDPFFDQDGGRLVYFEGTYVDTFSNAKTPTPRYNYNQLMYRLSLDDSRLALPIAVYRVHETNGAFSLQGREQIESAAAWERVEDVAWYGLPSGVEYKNVISIYASEPIALELSLKPPTPASRPLFAGLSLADASVKTSPDEHNSPSLVVLREYHRTVGGGKLYSTSNQPPPECASESRPLCRVWKNPASVLVLDWKAKLVNGN